MQVYSVEVVNFNTSLLANYSRQNKIHFHCHPDETSYGGDTPNLLCSFKHAISQGLFGDLCREAYAGIGQKTKVTCSMEWTDAKVSTPRYEIVYCAVWS